MNRAMFESSLVQQMMVGGNPSWWNNMDNIKPPHQETSPLLPCSTSSAGAAASSSSSSTSSSSSSSSSSSLNSFPMYPQYTQPSRFLPITSWQDNQDLPEPWSQLLLGGGVMEEEERCSFGPFQTKKVENWEDHQLYPSGNSHALFGVKQENLERSAYLCKKYEHDQEILKATSPWAQSLPASSPKSCVTTSGLSTNMLDFSHSKEGKRHLQSEQSSESNSTGTGTALKKARVQASSGQSPLIKVRKEKLGDRISALHQLVSPFGKTDTASVLLEAIGYIRFLQSQIEALSLPYLDSGSRNPRHCGKRERSNIFQEDHGKDAAAYEEPKKDLRSRGLCLVPVSFTLHVGGDNGADYWAPAFGEEFR